MPVTSRFSSSLRLHLEVAGPRHVFVGRGAEELGDRLGGEAARHVARAVPAHAVGHEEELVLVHDGAAVLVVVALPTDVGQRPAATARMT
jgi:hypothetical protein